ncbi:hypothetical protein UFOVP529_15 [uncultured Caudovirales phage]|uniref:Uncharacterized protein n=1 Tax=uncultured Caudovirales phage TaxID=2100421 RepID=A0A6J5R0M8_9CAUD|nr:hypothetical protein UFOVP529_15 [uncultured Caudovirales phage]CAB4190580.1 hypothetical protein UFOVP1191_73 [uncultured Caudovirales phage]CAB4194526.1 hypothetical protein UFOVP1252_105 [uncultured Caudovirales phage]
MLKGEDEETADSDIDSIMRAIHNELASAVPPEHMHPMEEEDDDTER